MLKVAFKVLFFINLISLNNKAINIIIREINYL